MAYEYILFDLDGTITESGTGIKNSVVYALRKFEITMEDQEILNRFVGPPLLNSFQMFCGLSMLEAKKAVEYYREYFVEKGMFENEVYEGIEEVLRALKESGKSLIVATSKPEVYARKILQHFHLDTYFTYIAGSNLDGSRNDKSEVIQYALNSCSIHELSNVVMIGDREHDIIGAKKVDIDSIGVLYGYGTREELEEAGADRIVESVNDIVNLLI